MKRILIIPLLILYCATMVNADVYTWTDAQGTVTYAEPGLVASVASWPVFRR
jgi:hypothetical protein